MELTRKQVIEELQKMLDYCSIRQDSTPERKQALVYAISSLKADEAYQLMYEGEEVYTKADVAAMFNDLLHEINSIEKDICINDDKSEMGFVRWIRQSDVMKIIQQTIDKLKEDSE